MGRLTGSGDQGRAMANLRTMAFALAVGATFLFCGAATASEFAVTEAIWKPENLLLRLEGTARQPGSVVLVRDASTLALLGSAAVRADGKWMLKIRSPANVPSRARVEAGSKCVECTVEGADSSK